MDPRINRRPNHEPTRLVTRHKVDRALQPQDRQRRGLDVKQVAHEQAILGDAVLEKVEPARVLGRVARPDHGQAGVAHEPAPEGEDGEDEALEGRVGLDHAGLDRALERGAVEEADLRVDVDEEGVDQGGGEVGWGEGHARGLPVVRVLEEVVDERDAHREGLGVLPDLRVEVFGQGRAGGRAEEALLCWANKNATWVSRNPQSRSPG